MIIPESSSGILIINHKEKKLPMPVTDINGTKIRYEIEGQGFPLVMIMGLGASQKIWGPQVIAFKKHYQVITFDKKGTGRTDKPVGPDIIKNMAGVTIGLMDRLGIPKANILGVSMGGMIAQEIAINFPHRVSRLILGCTYAGNPSLGPTEKVVQMIKSSSSGLGTDFINLAYNKPLNKFVISLKIMIHSRFKNHSGKTAVQTRYTDQIEACLNFNSIDKLPSIKAPTLVITGSKDRVVKPGSSEAIAKLIPNARLVIIKNGSHFFHAELKNEFNREVLNFMMQD
jgi:3-oxoadipate enol-lactonase